MELPLNILRGIRRYQPITSDDLTLYPVLVREYENFLIARPALEVLHQSLPVALMRVPLLSALYRIDIEAVLNGGEAVGIFSRALLMLALSLRLGEGLDVEGRIRQFRVLYDRDDPAKLIGLVFEDSGGKEHQISPATFQKIRPIIAAQNGVKLESDEANPDIVKAKKDMAAASAGNLDPNIDDLIYAIAVLTQHDETEIDEWPILKLENTSKSFERILGYIVCGVAEGSGATWKTGNPVPHPFFSKLDNGAGMFAPLDSNNDSGGKTEAPERIRRIAEQTIQYP